VHPAGQPASSIITFRWMKSPVCRPSAIPPGKTSEDQPRSRVQEAGRLFHIARAGSPGGSRPARKIVTAVWNSLACCPTSTRRIPPNAPSDYRTIIPRTLPKRHRPGPASSLCCCPIGDSPPLRYLVLSWSSRVSPEIATRAGIEAPTQCSISNRQAYRSNGEMATAK